MLTRSEICIPKILKHEGGYVNHPSDPGGATNLGITIGTFRRYIKPKGTIADLKKLTQAQAVVVYKGQYWDAVHADLLPYGVDYSVADFAVNSGPSRAARELQRAVGATVDGKIGPQTIAAVRAMPAKDVIRQINARRLAFMKRIRGGKLWVTFGRGWQRRVDDVLAQSLRDAGQAVAPTPAPAQSPIAAIIAAILAIFGKGRK